LKIEFNSLGGQVSKVELAKYKAYNHKTDNADLPLYLIIKIIQTTVFSLKIKQEK
jgi:YidC/Oxa1 family membrane protein insertase